MIAAKAKLKESPKPRSGRPTRERAERISQQIIQIAMRLFTETSFDATSVDLIAATAGISKQTFYARFTSKEVLLTAVIRNALDDLMERFNTEQYRQGPIDGILVAIAFELSERALAPRGIAFERMMSAEAHRVPELAVAYHENAFLHARDLIAEVFAAAMRNEQIRPNDASFLAEQFMYAVIGGPTRTMMLSGKIPKSKKILRDRICKAVDLFLDGCRVGADGSG